MHATFEILLEQPLIISQQAASAGAHQSLDYIPGSVLLGLAASRLYANLPAQTAFTLFHNGIVRFGDALPVDQGETGLPMPLNWHLYKGESARLHDQLLADRLFDPALRETDPARQPVQQRSGYTTPSGRLLHPQRQHTLKTAIDRSTGMAAESQLFGYEALGAGQRFRFTLQADDDLPVEHWQMLLDNLNGKARLGRSRSAQFGQVSIQALPAQPLPAPADQGDTLTLWLLSDLLLEDQGQPCLTPEPHLLGLPPGSQLLSEQSFLRSRRYSVYNAYRRHYDSERQVISRGSILRYRLARALTDAELATLQQGIGLQIEAGLGQVWANSPLVTGAHPAFLPAPATVEAARTAAPRPDSLLVRVLEQRQQRRLGDALPEQQARQLFSDLCQRVLEARNYLAVADGVPLEAPGRSQWGRLKELASARRGDPAQLWNDLSNAENGILRDRKKTDTSGWDLRFGPQPRQQLGVWLREALEPFSNAPHLDRLIGHLAVFGLQPGWIACCEGQPQEHCA